MGEGGISTEEAEKVAGTHSGESTVLNQELPQEANSEQPKTREEVHQAYLKATDQWGPFRDYIEGSVDSSIVDTAVALQASGFEVFRFNMRDIEGFTRAPWVDVGAQGIDDLRISASEAYTDAWKSRDKDTPGTTSQETEARFEKYHRLRGQVEQKNLEAGKKLLDSINKFYENRSPVTSNSRLGIQVNPIDGESRLISQGALFLDTLDPLKEGAREREAMQEEMKAFTSFMMDKLYHNTTGPVPKDFLHPKKETVEQPKSKPEEVVHQQVVAPSQTGESLEAGRPPSQAEVQTPRLDEAIRQEEVRQNTAPQMTTAPAQNVTPISRPARFRVLSRIFGRKAA